MPKDFTQKDFDQLIDIITAAFTGAPQPKLETASNVQEVTELALNQCVEIYRATAARLCEQAGIERTRAIEQEFDKAFKPLMFLMLASGIAVSCSEIRAMDQKEGPVGLILEVAKAVDPHTVEGYRMGTEMAADLLYKQTQSWIDYSLKLIKEYHRETAVPDDTTGAAAEQEVDDPVI